MPKKVREGARAYPGGTIPAGEFKARCLQIMDDVAETHAEVVITKYGRPVAKLVPVDDETPDSFGAMAGTVSYLENDLVSPDHEAWGDGSGDEIWDEVGGQESLPDGPEGGPER